MPRFVYLFLPLISLLHPLYVYFSALRLEPHSPSDKALLTRLCFLYGSLQCAPLFIPATGLYLGIYRNPLDLLHPLQSHPWLLAGFLGFAPFWFTTLIWVFGFQGDQTLLRYRRSFGMPSRIESIRRMILICILGGAAFPVVLSALAELRGENSSVPQHPAATRATLYRFTSQPKSA